jgi:hypothetical protein
MYCPQQSSSENNKHSTSTKPSEQKDEEKARTVKSPADVVDSNPIRSPRAELINWIIEKATGIPNESFTRKSAPDLVVTEDEYRKITADKDGFTVLLDQEKEINKLLNRHLSHDDKSQISDADIKQIAQILKLKNSYEIAEYMNVSSDKPKYTQQRLTLIEPLTGENLVILKGGPADLFSVNKNMGFSAFEGYEEDILKIMLSGNQNKESIKLLSNIKTIDFSPGKESEKYDSVTLTFKGQGISPESEKLELLFIKDTTLLAGLKDDKNTSEMEQIKMPKRP